jgi:hypothetical protein
MPAKKRPTSASTPLSFPKHSCRRILPEFHLPGAQVAAEVTKSDKLLPATLDLPDENEQRSKASVEPVTMCLDTLCLMPDEKRFYLVWRGLCRVMNLTAIEVQKIQIEDQSRCPKPLFIPKTQSID